MSLIEQAARRLEELRKAGAQLPEGSARAATEATGARTAGDVVPTPEAVADAIAAQVESPPESRRIGQRCRQVLGGRPGDGAPFAPRVGRRIDIDIDRLRELGFVTPDAPTAADCRRIPRDQAADYP